MAEEADVGGSVHDGERGDPAEILAGSSYHQAC